MSRRQIHEWVERHPEAMPHDLADLAGFPMPFRRVMVNAASPEVRLLLWRQHLESFLGDSSVFDQKQQRMIAWAIQRLPDVLAAPAPNPVMTDFEREIASAFSRSEAAQLFMLIGPPEPPGGIPLPADAIPGAP